MAYPSVGVRHWHFKAVRIALYSAVGIQGSTITRRQIVEWPWKDRASNFSTSDEQRAVVKNNWYTKGRFSCICARR